MPPKQTRRFIAIDKETGIKYTIIEFTHTLTYSTTKEVIEIRKRYETFEGQEVIKVNSSFFICGGKDPLEVFEIK